MFKWLKDKLFGSDQFSYYDEPTVEIVPLSKKQKKIVPKIKAVKKPAVKKPTVKKKPTVAKPKK